MTSARVRARILSLLVVSALALGLTAIPVTAASAATAKTGTIRVQALTPAGKILHKAGIGIYLSTAKTSRHALTNSSGVAVLRKVRTHVKFYLGSFATDPYVQANRSGITVKAGKTTKVSLKLAAKGSISGTLLDNHGAPVAGIPVAALLTNGTSAASAVTTKQGGYTLAGLSTGAYSVAFVAPLPRDSTDYGYVGARWNGGQIIDVHTQTRTKAATKAVANGVVTKYTTVSGSVTVASPTMVTFSAPNFTKSAFVVDGDFSIAVPAGDYVVSVASSAGGAGPFYYTGERQAVSPAAADAVAVIVTPDGSIHLSVGATP